MKKVVTVLLVVVTVLSLAACAGGNEPSGGISAAPPQIGTEEPEPSAVPSETEGENGQPDATPEGSPTEAESAKVLVAYFSATGNTKSVAEKIAAALDGAELYEILPEEPYTSADLDYNSDCRANSEQNDPDARPAISGSVGNMADYDVVFLGYPIWWGEAPRIMSTFVESYDFSGKTVIPFCTSGSSGFGSSDAALKAAAGGAEWLDGRRFSGSASADDVSAWVDGLKLN